MKEDQHRFLSLLGGLPARLTAEQAAWVLNCQAHDVPVLVAARLLKPLGNPPPNGIKFFATEDLIELRKDRGWLVRMTNTVCQHWQKKNGRKKEHLRPNHGASFSEASKMLLRRELPGIVNDPVDNLIKPLPQSD